MARFDASCNFYIQGEYTIRGEREALLRANAFLEGWYDKSMWLYDHPNDMKSFLIELMEQRGEYTHELVEAYPHTDAWMSYFGLDDEGDFLEIDAEGFLRGQTDAVSYFCEAFCLSYEYEEWDTRK